MTSTIDPSLRMYRFSSWYRGISPRASLVRQLDVRVEIVGMRDVLKGQLRQLIRAVAGDLAEGPIDANEAAVEGDERHPDRSFVDREPKPLLGLPQLSLADLRLLASALLVRQKLLALLGDPARFRDVARDGADAEDPLAARVADAGNACRRPGSSRACGSSETASRRTTGRARSSP